MYNAHTNGDTLVCAPDRFKYWLYFTGNARTAAGVTNKQLGLNLTTGEYKELLEAENRSSVESGES